MSRSRERRPAPRWTPSRRLALVRWVVVLGMLAALGISHRLFLQHPFLGPIPVAAWIPVPPAPMDRVWLALIVGLLLPIPFIRDPRRLILVWCALFFARCGWDRITWQPYFLQYGFMLLSLAFVDWRADAKGDARRRRVLDTNRLILVCIYFWSGFSKLNYANMVSPGLEFLEEQLPGIGRGLPVLVVLSAAIPFIEMGFALGLAIPRLRRVSMWAGIAMHVLILTVYGPLVRVENPVIWPWNVAMICLLVGLFSEAPESSFGKIFWGRGLALQRVALVLFAICPLLSYADLWSHYLSFRLYSHHSHHGLLVLQRSVIDTLPAEVRRHVQDSEVPGVDGELHLQAWAERQLLAFPPIDRPVIEQIGANLCSLSREPGDMTLVIRRPPHRFTGETDYDLFSCQLTPTGGLRAREPAAR